MDVTQLRHFVRTILVQKTSVASKVIFHGRRVLFRSYESTCPMTLLRIVQVPYVIVAFFLTQERVPCAKSRIHLYLFALQHEHYSSAYVLLIYIMSMHIKCLAVILRIFFIRYSNEALKIFKLLIRMKNCIRKLCTLYTNVSSQKTSIQNT